MNIFIRGEREVFREFTLFRNTQISSFFFFFIRFYWIIFILRIIDCSVNRFSFSNKHSSPHNTTRAWYFQCATAVAYYVLCFDFPVFCFVTKRAYYISVNIFDRLWGEKILITPNVWQLFVKLRGHVSNPYYVAGGILQNKTRDIK